MADRIVKDALCNTIKLLQQSDQVWLERRIHIILRGFVNNQCFENRLYKSIIVLPI